MSTLASVAAPAAPAPPTTATKRSNFSIASLIGNNSENEQSPTSNDEGNEIISDSKLSVKRGRSPTPSSPHSEEDGDELRSKRNKCNTSLFSSSSSNSNGVFTDALGEQQHLQQLGSWAAAAAAAGRYERMFDSLLLGAYSRSLQAANSSLQNAGSFKSASFNANASDGDTQQLASFKYGTSVSHDSAATAAASSNGGHQFRSSPRTSEGSYGGGVGAEGLVGLAPSTQPRFGSAFSSHIPGELLSKGQGHHLTTSPTDANFSHMTDFLHSAAAAAAAARMGSDGGSGFEPWSSVGSFFPRPLADMHASPQSAGILSSNNSHHYSPLARRSLSSSHAGDSSYYTSAFNNSAPFDSAAVFRLQQSGK